MTRDRSLGGLAIEARRWARWLRALDRPEARDTLRAVGLDPIPTADRLDALWDRVITTESAAQEVEVGRRATRDERLDAITAFHTDRKQWFLRLDLAEPAAFTSARGWWSEAMAARPHRPTTTAAVAAQLHHLRAVLTSWHPLPDELAPVVADLDRHAAVFADLEDRAASGRVARTAQARKPLADTLDAELRQVRRRARIARQHDPSIPEPDLSDD